MLSTSKLRAIYSKIQTQLYYMIPEKWEKICLYASVIEQVNNLQTGEMFFYYYPTGLLKKEPVNVYEIPSKFNIDENAYMELVDKLYKTIYELREAFKDTEEKMWTNLTIVVENFKFNVEYAYEDLIGSKYDSYDRHIIWKCKYLDFPLERLKKKDRKMVEEYFENISDGQKRTKTYSEGLYKKKVHNIVEYNTEEKPERSIKDNVKVEEKTRKLTSKNEVKLDKYELYKLKQAEKKKKEQEEIAKMKNQILNM